MSVWASRTLAAISASDAPIVAGATPAAFFRCPIAPETSNLALLTSSGEMLPGFSCVNATWFDARELLSSKTHCWSGDKRAADIAPARGTATQRQSRQCRNEPPPVHVRKPTASAVRL